MRDWNQLGKDGEGAATRLYETIFEHAPIGIEIYDQQGLLVEVNKKCLEIFGVTDVSFIKAFELFDAPNISEEKREVLKQGGSLHYEAPYDFDLVRQLNLYPTSKTGKAFLSVIVEPVKNLLSQQTSGYAVLVQDITERKKTELALEEERRLFSLLLEHSPIWVFFKDENLRSLRLSRNFEQMLGMPLEQALGKSMEELFPSDLARAMMRDDRRIIASGRMDRVEEELHGRSFETIKFPIVKQGSPSLLAGFTIDITERKRAEQALRESEQRLRLALDAAAAGVWQWNLKTNENIWSEELWSLYGLVPHSCAPSYETWLQTIHPEDREKASQTVGEAARQSTELNAEWRRPDGRWLMSRGRPLKNAAGEIDRYIGIVIDITARKQAESEIHLAKSRMNYALQAAQIGVWELDLVDMTTWRSAKHDEIFGYANLLPHWSSEIFLEHVLPEDRAVVKEALQRTIDTQVDQRFECRIRRTDGEVRWIWARGNPQFDEHGKPTKMFGIIQDITEQKRAEEALQRAQKLDSLGILAGGIAHDFNNLLGGIFGYIDLACGDSTEEPVISSLSKALSCMDRARGLTQQLLTFAKGGAPVKKPAQLFPFIQEAAQFALSGSDVTCRIDVTPDLWVCNVDKNQIGQVIDNLMINAQQAMPMGGIIDLAACNVPQGAKRPPALDAGNYVKISVKDRGIGMPPELLPRIFDPFFTTKAKGHGLGLSTCYSIIHRHGGCIDVESEPGKGSTFYIFLPASGESVLPAAEQAEAKHRGTGTILIMDDEESMRNAMRDILEMFGYRVVCKQDGRDAIGFFVEETKAKRKIAAMILDLTVPGGMGGKEAIGEIRKLCSEIPVFVVSGYAEDPVMANPSAYGFTASLCKPFRTAELARMLSRYLNASE
jgi:PAS domain S-box-containing protein